MVRINLDVDEDTANRLTAEAVLTRRSRNLLLKTILEDWLHLTAEELAARTQHIARSRAASRVRGTTPYGKPR